jgi:hypothetical protein
LASTEQSSGSQEWTHVFSQMMYLLLEECNFYVLYSIEEGYKELLVS